MLNVAIVAEDREHIYVWPPGVEKPVWRRCHGIFEPVPIAQPVSGARTYRMRRRLTTVHDMELQLLGESVAMAREPSSSQLLWQNSKARINVLTAFGVFGTTLAYSTYFQARSEDKTPPIVLHMLIASFGIFLCGTVGSIGLQLAFTDDKPSTLTYMHWLTLPLDVVTCIFMTCGTVTLTQAIAWTMGNKKAGFRVFCVTMGIMPLLAVWLPAVLVARRNWGVIWPAVCDASSAMRDAFSEMLSFRYLRPVKKRNTAGVNSAIPTLPEALDAQYFLEMYSHYGGALHYAQTKLRWLYSLDDSVRADMFRELVSSLCPHAQWEVANDPNGTNEGLEQSCMKFLRLAQRWAGVAEEMHRLSAAPTIKASYSQDDRVGRFLALDKVFESAPPSAA